MKVGRYDRMKRALKEQLEISDNVMRLLLRFLEQNKGTLSKRAREQEFSQFSAEECAQIEALYAEIFT